MRVLVIGGTGFIGTYCVHELLDRGHKVTVLSRHSPTKNNKLPKGVKFIRNDLFRMDQGKLARTLAPMDAFIFGAGVDDRIHPPKPAYKYFHSHNVEQLVKVVKAANQADVTKGVVLGSYFSYFDRKWPHMGIAKHHPYIRSRVDQAKMGFKAACDDLDLMVLEIPYVFGSIPDKVPLWAPLVNYIRSPWPLFYPRGGTSVMAVERVAEATVGGLERGKGEKSYPLGDENMTWVQLLTRMANLMGKKKSIITLPDPMVKTSMFMMGAKLNMQGRESGLDPVAFTDLQTSKTFIDPKASRKALRYGKGGLDKALKATIKASPQQKLVTEWAWGMLTRP